jgi:hypothetical protein
MSGCIIAILLFHGDVKFCGWGTARVLGGGGSGFKRSTGESGKEAGAGKGCSRKNTSQSKKFDNGNK